MHCAPSKDMNCVVCDNAFDPLQNNHSSRSVICSFELLNHFLRIVLYVLLFDYKFLCDSYIVQY